jgi:hypothetical protein
MLRGWDAIFTHLDARPSIVRRLHARLWDPLPIHNHGKGGVYAIPSEIAAWQRRQGARRMVARAPRIVASLAPSTMGARQIESVFSIELDA